VATTLLVLLLVILPTVITAAFIVQEGMALFEKLRSGEIDLASYYQQVMKVLPAWLANLLRSLEISNLPALQAKLKESAAQGTQPIATHLFSFGQNMLDFVVSFFVMLYVLFFLLKDGKGLMQKIRRAAPLEHMAQQRFFENVTAVIRATVKGNVVVALVQGALGGLALMVLGIPGALLWGVVMALLSLLPAIGAALVWGPVAVWLLVSGQVWQGVALAAFGTVVIGLVDNVLRPMLVGKETRLPDYVVLVSTIGGMSLFGINGFVIGPVVAAMFMSAWELAAAEKSRRTA
jgi:predicted PurR-regulated permease PerM